ncbi:methylenetetrahydrofolate--tRNA-(uracil(54)-C(5))-methyltransferase (FADH(2)-oxidizing) TrmFO [Bosea sp. (in: a-proteobacteria)]|uniref:methylenetetrahydrofolate--tRNA-(uracil(54)- C(5))-methyltransferase (FADH(2)-oxidizing) TrmFO n=1 Tax=Bosea sp. (in: a-proteobacteria) TaxID=1871050 RepID=UPI002629B07E|nr:methylenetetrahydrofolate--tRNA-(uracil(54)-C(5))-methyltransferase (FADH(2)-oxidizing) TrmFO [Bosea sp. (in: a-proteobacteria)]MCO5093074.1 methylenetetrahydrofolate--tRNA-(uracil(54)-C(5))-methyltransferase (FADH(2)-oxidizing) TrmFO [Bosea sp. (in: a-proteobacteria)]
MKPASLNPVHVIGGGLAGSEAAWQVAEAGVPVVIHEMRPVRATDAHKTEALAELVCSNSFRSDDSSGNAVGQLHWEMRRLGSLIMAKGDAHQVPAGGALAVDRDGFSQAVTAALEAHPLVSIERGEIAGLPPAAWDNVIVATGPLTSPGLAQGLQALTGEDSLAFFDAIAPIVHVDSIDMETAWFQSRYDKAGPGGTGADYINCPLTKDQYEAFIDALLSAEKTEFKEWEGTPYFDGCLPIEVMAERGRETLRWGPMKPVGLTNRHNPTVKPHAVVQLRQDNALGTLFNMTGFQTKLKYGEQAAIFRMIPGLQNAEFARLGGIHRNTYLNSPKLLDDLLRLKADPRLRFAGQITGCEGYVESAATGLLAGRMAAAARLGRALPLPPATTALGALVNHITGGHIETIDEGPRSFQPMNINFGLFPPIAGVATTGPDGKRLKGPARSIARKQALTARAKEAMDAWARSVAAEITPAAPPATGSIAGASPAG